MFRSQWRSLMVLAFAVGTVAIGYSMAGTHSETAESERALAFEQVPDAVKAAILAEILHECFDLEIEEEAEGEDGQLVYEVEFEFDDVEVELEIAANGEVLEKDISHEDDDDDDDDDEDDDDDDDDDD